MRQLTFKGFLTQYVKELSRAGTLDLAVLAGEVACDNYRLRAPLLLYAVKSGKAGLLRSHLSKLEGAESLLTMLSSLENDHIEEALEGGKLPEDYLKVWNSFKIRCSRSKNEDELIGAMRRKIIQLQQTKKCSNYRLYKDLNLNPGNINSWLKNGDNSKVSYQTASRIISYMIERPAVHHDPHP